MNDTIERSQAHATFAIERIYPVPVEAVWHALSDNDARDQWFSGGQAFDVREKSHEFRVGGHGTEEGQWHGGPRSRFHSTYTDIVDLRRIVFTYDMWVNGQHLSTSLTTIALENERRSDPADLHRAGGAFRRAGQRRGPGRGHARNSRPARLLPGRRPLFETPMP